MISISKRLKVLSNFVLDNSKVIDVGCDHGLLPIYLVLNKKNIKVIASDISIQALKQTKSNIKKYKLDSKIITRFGNGLDVINKGEVDTVIISGLGMQKIIAILYKNRSKLQSVKKIIIQSNTNIPIIREKICWLGYYIKDEILIAENNIIYTIILFDKGKKRYPKQELLLGPVLLNNKCLLFNKQLATEIKKKELLLKLIPHKYLIKRVLIKKDLKLLIREIKNLYH